MVMPHFIHLLRELEKLQLPKRDFAIFGSAQLAAKEIRDTGDLDIIVRPNLWRELARKYSVKQQGRSLKITIGKIEIYNNWEPWFNDVNILIDKAEIINGLPYVSLEYFVQWKNAYGRAKDLHDLDLLNQLLGSKKAYL